MPNKKYLSMLGMARRAGKLSMGHDMAVKAVMEHKTDLVIFACDVSDRLIEEFKVYVKKANTNTEIKKIAESIDDIHRALGYKAGVITVDDTNLSGRIKELINQEENEYGNKD
ncbi:ribosomal L7Ae/L30e/S12e/Gadd45 family protein [uncultured Eubacterium sp.]|uniref:ribosomal L7Ae/L30e/S12e/Gadd45 family protein n=1 Tax=uncultured Eubacterium sp. TaxID=165185 RepID=UPI0015BBDB8D|nr:ribosomal L7Ae/L30e/S12e/Gadd45 family protein [uncultured Eubacterium sp.]